VVLEICHPGVKKKFGGTAPEPPRGVLAAPPLTPLRAWRRRSDPVTHAKNITHTQQFRSKYFFACGYPYH